MKVSRWVLLSFFGSSSHAGILGLPKGERWKLTDFIASCKGTLQHDFAQLSEVHKSNYVTRLTQEGARKQAIVRDQPKAVQRKMSAAFDAMDKEVYFTVLQIYYITDLTAVDFIVFQPRNRRILYCSAWGGGRPQRTQDLLLSQGRQVCPLGVGSRTSPLGSQIRVLCCLGSR